MTRFSLRTGLLLAPLVSGLALTGWAEEPTPTPTPEPKGESTLSDVAGGIELNKDATGGQGSIVISNENLSEYAEKGLLTEVTKQGGNQSRRSLPDVQGTGAEIEGEVPGHAENLEKKQYWQAVYVQQLELVGDLRKQIDTLDYKIPGLWRDFYSRDDPAYRDGVIKPQLDEALAQRQKLEVDLQKAEGKLAEIKQSAIKDGGQPGWFRGFAKLPTPKPTVGVMPP